MENYIFCLAGLLFGTMIFIIGFVLGEKSEKRRADNNMECIEALLNDAAQIVEYVYNAFKEDREDNKYKYRPHSKRMPGQWYFSDFQKDDSKESE